MGKHGRRTRDQMGKPKMRANKKGGKVAAASRTGYGMFNGSLVKYVSKAERKAAGGLEAAIAIKEKKGSSTAALKRRIAKARKKGPKGTDATADGAAGEAGEDDEEASDEDEDEDEVSC